MIRDLWVGVPTAAWAAWRERVHGGTNRDIGEEPPSKFWLGRHPPSLCSYKVFLGEHCLSQVWSAMMSPDRVTMLFETSREGPSSRGTSPLLVSRVSALQLGSVTQIETEVASGLFYRETLVGRQEGALPLSTLDVTVVQNPETHVYLSPEGHYTSVVVPRKGGVSRNVDVIENPQSDVSYVFDSRYKKHVDVSRQRVAGEVAHKRQQAVSIYVDSPVGWLAVEERVLTDVFPGLPLCQILSSGDLDRISLAMSLFGVDNYSVEHNQWVAVQKKPRRRSVSIGFSGFIDPTDLI